MHSAADPIILCGGAGTRLRSVTGEAPKSLARIGKRPFLEILFNQLRRHGFDRVILAVGYQKDLILSHFGEQAFGLRIAYSVELTPLGTGGAIRNALTLMQSDAALIMNGDSYTDVNSRELLADFQRANADLSVVAVPADGREDCGSLTVDPDGSIRGFREKQVLTGKAFLNAGIYIARKRILEEIAAGIPVSLETELFPRWLREGKNLRAFHHPGECIDIGTPDRFKNAQMALANTELNQSSTKQEARHA
ncbi:MAG TPA: nucleotidyltransferase family protein [Candidatus Sulfotelmatobacter sp.]|nr:nucleotidyltransferase family protein [Candidatus Sulfotelmatobacter sp.]